MSFAGVGPTELRVLLSGRALALFGHPRVGLGALGSFRLFDVGGAVAIAGIMATLVVSVTRKGGALARADAGEFGSA